MKRLPPGARQRSAASPRSAVLVLAAAAVLLSSVSVQRGDAGAQPAVSPAPSVVDIASLPLHHPPLREPEPPLRPPVETAPAEPEPRVVTAGRLRRGDTLASALRGRGVASRAVHVVAREMRPVFDFRHAQPGDRFQLVQRPGGDVVEFRYQTRSADRLRLLRRGDDFEVLRERPELEPRVSRLAGVITTSLYDSVRALGERSRLASDFAQLFAWDIDFSRGVQAGDEFAVVYQRLYRPGVDGEPVYVRPGRILAARYSGRGGSVHAFWFEGDDGRSGYYRGDGSALERAFLAAPLEYTRISSHYTRSRHHPILKVDRPHFGIDYAAPEGTAVWAVADGTVIYRGWGGGFGNLVKVRHANGYISYYAHLSRFREGLRSGESVEQREVIGYVGETGLATGPHVCFRVAKDGRYVNPRRVQSPAGRPIPDAQWTDFQLQRDALLSRLEGDGEALAARADSL